MSETNKLHIATICKSNKLCTISCCSNGWSSFTQNTCVMKQCHITKYTLYCIFPRCKNTKKEGLTQGPMEFCLIKFTLMYEQMFSSLKCMRNLGKCP